jgi:glycosyltransferase involved in cell wall biosynthesis
VPVHRLWIPERGVPVLNALALGIGIYGYVRQRQDEFDLLHAHQALYPAFAGVLAASRLGKPAIVKIANSGSRFDLNVLARQAGGVGRLVAKNLAARASAFITLNDSITADLQQWNVPKSRIHQIPNGVMVPSKKALKQLRARRTLHLPCERPILISVGSLQVKKNQTILIDALKEVIQPNYDPLLLLLGDGNLREALEQQVAQLGLTAHVKFCGRVSNVSDYLEAADIFVLPSLVEGLSNALLEAMSYGLPCIASDIAGNRRVIRGGENGLLFASNDSLALSEAILALLSNAIEANRLGEAAYQTIIADYSIEQVAERYLHLYQTLL